MREKRKRSAAVCIVFVLSVLSLTLYTEKPVMAEETEPENLYAQSAVLMDADSGRILFTKNGEEERAMASTTKIMTCILALENGDLSSEVTASGNAASQPQVKLGMREGQRFSLNDLLYSLMLESHNDSAVAIAEHISGSVEEFVALMNQKAKELDCHDTYFITPNGLDAQDANGIHHTTAEDLARIMRYCIMYSEEKDKFLEITRTKTHTFQDCEGNGSYTCNNHNSFLNMMEGALSGKTGFTADAGYCYVGALRDGERTFIVALLACGWPNNKGYKWSDTRKLMSYGLENYYYREIGAEPEMLSVRVPDGVKDTAAKPAEARGGYAGGAAKSAVSGAEITKQGESGSGAEKDKNSGRAVKQGNPAGEKRGRRYGDFPDSEGTVLDAVSGTKTFDMLLKNDEEVTVEYNVPKEVAAPVKKGETLGTVTYSLNGKEIGEFPVTAAENIQKRTFSVCLFYIRDTLFL